MDKATRCIEVRMADGQLLFRLHLVEKEVDFQQKKPNPGNPKPDNKGGDQGGNRRNSNGNGSELMSDAQKRYLFRILADQGIEGDDAYQYLKNMFQVEVLKDATKRAASQVISQLLEEGQQGG